ncbi:hypothetical protein HF086_008270 [Spodoptera exigua]|uniref:Anoctamin n=1 Tax=Spodoptera exigua TaxID=7107 RepID=A0A922MD49_SPOEX|nr:hypothetical protein HF086_008270 [Spodoptera exigua]
MCPQVQINFRDNGSEASTRPAEDFTCGDPAITLGPNGNGKPPANHCSIVMGGILNNPSLTFNDGVRSIDYVLVWEAFKEDASTAAAYEQRKIFEQNLELEGLQLEREAPENFKIKKSGQANAIVQAALYMSKVCIRYEHGFANLALGWAPKLYVTECFWTPSIRSRIVQFILDRKKFSEATNDDFAFGITRLISNCTYSAAYPLHDGDLKTPGSMRHLLYTEWAAVSKCIKYQPLDYVKDYFGVKIGLYFAWLGFYTHMLIPASIVGVICVIYSAATVYDNTPREFAIVLMRKSYDLTREEGCLVVVERGNRRTGTDGTILAHASPGNPHVVQCSRSSSPNGPSYGTRGGPIPNVPFGRHNLAKRKCSNYVQPYNVYYGDGCLHQFVLHLFVQLFLQYGFVTIFVAAFPLAPLFALINNVLEMRLDAKKFLTCYRRPVPQRVNDIGVWYRILDSIGKLSIITNGFIIAFTSDFIPRLVYQFTNGSMNQYVNNTLADFNISVLEHPPIKTTYNETMCSFPGYWYYKEGDSYEHSNWYWHIMGARLAFVVVFENVVALVMIIVRWAIPDMSGELRDRIRREAYVINSFILEETRARSVRDQGAAHSTPV